MSTLKNILFYWHVVYNLNYGSVKCYYMALLWNLAPQSTPTSRTESKLAAKDSNLHLNLPQIVMFAQGGRAVDQQTSTLIKEELPSRPSPCLPFKHVFFLTWVFGNYIILNFRADFFISFVKSKRILKEANQC